MTDTGFRAAGESQAFKDLNPLLIYEAKFVGHELRPFVPKGDERRETALRKDKSLLKTWRGIPKESSAGASLSLKEGLTCMRQLETERDSNNERLFGIVLASMCVILGSIFVFFFMHFLH